MEDIPEANIFVFDDGLKTINFPFEPDEPNRFPMIHKTQEPFFDINEYSRYTQKRDRELYLLILHDIDNFRREQIFDNIPNEDQEDIDDLQKLEKYYEKFKNLKFHKVEQTPEKCLENINGFNLQYIDNQTEEICIKAVKCNFNEYKYVKNKTPAVKIEAILKNPKLLQKNEQTPELCQNLYNRDKNIFRFLQYQTNEMCLDMIKKDYMNFLFVKNPTDEMSNDVVKKCGLMLEYIENQTEEMCIDAVKENDIALKFVKSKTPKILIYASRKDSDILDCDFVRNLSNRDLLELVKLNPYVIKYIPKERHTWLLGYEAVQRVGSLIQYIDKYVVDNQPHQPHEEIINGVIWIEPPEIQGEGISMDGKKIDLRETAVALNGLNLQYVKDQTDEICIKAVRNNIKAIQYVKNKSQDFIITICDFEPNILRYVDQTPELCQRIFDISIYVNLPIGMLYQNLQYKTEEMSLKLIKRDCRNILFVDDQTENICINAVQKDGLMLEFVKNQTDKICLEAIKNNVEAFKFVKNKTLDFCMQAYKLNNEILRLPDFLKIVCNDINSLTDILKINGLAIQYIQNQTPELCLLAVNNNGLAIQYIQNKTPELCLLAVKNNGLAIKFIENQTEEICIEAVKHDGTLLKFVKRQSELICIESVKHPKFFELDNNGIEKFNISYNILPLIKNLSNEIILEAVKHNGLELENVPLNMLTDEIKTEAVKQNGTSLQFINEQTDNICLEAVKNYGKSLRYVKKQTENICLEAVKNYPDAIIYVDKQTLPIWKNVIDNIRKSKSIALIVQNIRSEFLQDFMKYMNEKYNVGVDSNYTSLQKMLDENKIQEVVDKLHLQVTDTFGIENETIDDCKCMICLNKEGHIIRTKCGHYYCLEKLFEWFKLKSDDGETNFEQKCLYCFQQINWNECILKV